MVIDNTDPALVEFYSKMSIEKSMEFFNEDAGPF